MDDRSKGEAKAEELRVLAAKTKDPAKRDRLHDAAAEHAGSALNGAAAPRETA